MKVFIKVSSKQSCRGLAEGSTNEIHLVWRAQPTTSVDPTQNPAGLPPDLLYLLKHAEGLWRKVHLKKKRIQTNSKQHKVIITDSKMHVGSSHWAFISVPIIAIFVIINDALSKLYSSNVD